MNISGLLGTFASSLRFYIDEFERIIHHVSANLPLVSNQIECHIKEARGLLESSPDDSKIYGALLVEMSSVRVPIFEIIIELQKEDIINQQMTHLLEAVEDVQNIINENNILFVDYSEKKENQRFNEDFRHIFTLISFLLKSIEKQMNRINRELMDLVKVLEDQFKSMQTIITSVHNGKHSIENQKGELAKSFRSIINITENLAEELEQYSSFFIRLRLLQDDINREVSICSGLKKEVMEDLNSFGGSIPLNQCRFSNSVIQKIVNRLSVEEERQTMRDEFSDLEIEERSANDFTLF